MQGMVLNEINPQHLYILINGASKIELWRYQRGDLVHHHTASKRQASTCLNI